MTMARHFLLLLMTGILLFSFACKKKKDSAETKLNATPTGYLIPSSLADDTLLLYAKTPCFGACPTFRLMIKMNGEIRYEGQKNVNLLGTYKGNWSKEQMIALDQEMKKINFYHFQKIYDNPVVTDLPSMYIGYTKGNDLYKIKCRVQYPNELKSLSQWLDTQINTTEFQQTEKLQNNE